MGLVTDRALSASEFLAERIAFKKNQTPRGHFLRGLVMGKLSPEQVRMWAKDFYYYVEPAIPNIAALLAAAPILPDCEPTS